MFGMRARRVMAQTMRLRVAGVVVAWLSVALALVGLVEGCSCTLLGCQDTMRARMVLTRALEELDGGRVTVCRELQCTDYALNVERKAGGVAASCPIASQVRCDAEGTADEARDALLVQYSAFSRDAPPVEGQVFTVRVLDSDGAVVAERSGAVSFARWYPNGESCGSACRTGALP
jgi:hypothetical protein